MIRKVAEIKQSDSSPKVRHFEGLPPDSGKPNGRRQLPCATKLLLEETNEGLFLYRFSDRGEALGDTWHKDLNEALHQAHYEYGIAENDWEEVPASVEDVLKYLFLR